MKHVGSRQKAEGRGKRLGGWILSAQCLLLAAYLVTTGCSNSARESADQRSEKTLRDPMGYSPQFEKTDVSGGGLLDYDKDGMRKDMKNVLDP